MTEPIEFETEENVPPVLLDPPGTATPIGSMAWIDLAGERTNWEIPVLIRDQNRYQEVALRWRVVTDIRPQPAFVMDEVPITGEVVRDEYIIRLTPGHFSQGRCHRLEMIASSSFTPQTAPELFEAVSDPEDLGRAVWWLLDGDGEDGTLDSAKVALLDSCDAVTALIEGPPP